MYKELTHVGYISESWFPRTNSVHLGQQGSKIATTDSDIGDNPELVRSNRPKPVH